MGIKTTISSTPREDSMRAVDLFCGAGGMSLGFQNAGFNVVAAYELDKHAVSIYRDNFKHPVYQQDINEEGIIEHIQQHNPDIIFGGPPCQDYSRAGKRVIGERAELTSRFDEIVAKVRSQWFVMENVAAIKTTGAEILAQAKQVFKTAGYGLTERVLNASHCGVPQNRKRYILVGCLGAEDDFIGGMLDSGLSSKPMTVRDYLRDIDTEYYYMTPNYNARAVYSIDEPCCTILRNNCPIPASYVMRPGDKADVASGVVRRLTTKERSLIQTFPDDFRWDSVSMTRAEKAIGNAVPVKLAEYVARTISNYINNAESEKNLCQKIEPRRITCREHTGERGANMAEIALKTLCDVKVEAVKWLWYPYIPQGKITIVQGDPGSAKTTMTLAMAADVSNGVALPGAEKTEPIDIIVCNGEDGLSDTIAPKLKNYGANESKIHFVDSFETGLTLDDERIRDMIISKNAKLLILDPIQAFLGKANINNANHMRPLMRGLANIANWTGCAVVLVGHLNKSGGRQSQYRGLGSIDIPAAARSVLTVGKLDEKGDSRAIVQTKSSLARAGASQEFCFDDSGRFVWLGECDATADDLLSSNKKENSGSKLDVAQQFIITTLNSSDMPANELMALASENGITERVLNEAKKILGVQSQKRGNVWYWVKPARQE